MKQTQDTKATPTVVATPCGNYAVKLPSGRYLAEQGNSRWEEDKPQGWALHVTREAAEQTIATLTQ